MTPQEYASEIRRRVQDLNETIERAAQAEVYVEIELLMDNRGPRHVKKIFDWVSTPL